MVVLVLELEEALAVEELEFVLEQWEKVPRNQHPLDWQRENTAYKGAIAATRFVRELVRYSLSKG